MMIYIDELCCVFLRKKGKHTDLVENDLMKMNDRRKERERCIIDDVRGVREGQKKCTLFDGAMGKDSQG